jgi:hypothetical protein
MMHVREFSRLARVVFHIVSSLAVAITANAVARAWMVAAQPTGTYANLDVVFPGAQAQLEQRIPIYGQANELDLKINALPTFYFYESQADIDLRIVVVTLGVSAGIRDVFFNLEFDPNRRFDTTGRRDAEKAGNYRNAFTTYGEGRLTLSLPFNDHLAMQSVNAMRHEGGADRTFDWRLGIVRDAGWLLRSDTTLLFKHRDFGAIGPQVQVLNFALNGQRNTQLNFGFTYVTRLGLFRKRNDLLFVGMLFGVLGHTNGVPTREVYGDHLFRVPVTLQLAYRMVFELIGPATLTE